MILSVLIFREHSTREPALFVQFQKRLISNLADALSPTDHKGLYQGWKQTSIHLLVIHSTNRHTTSFFFSNHNSNYIHNFGTQTQKNNSTCFGAHFYSVGTQHRNLHQSSVTMSRMTYSILLAHTETGVSHSKYRNNSGEVLGRIDRKGRNKQGRNQRQ